MNKTKKMKMTIKMTSNFCASIKKLRNREKNNNCTRENKSIDNQWQIDRRNC